MRGLSLFTGSWHRRLGRGSSGAIVLQFADFLILARKNHLKG